MSRKVIILLMLVKLAFSLSLAHAGMHSQFEGLVDEVAYRKNEDHEAARQDTIELLRQHGLATTVELNLLGKGEDSGLDLDREKEIVGKFEKTDTFKALATYDAAAHSSLAQNAGKAFATEAARANLLKRQKGLFAKIRDVFTAKHAEQEDQPDQGPYEIPAMSEASLELINFALRQAPSDGTPLDTLTIDEVAAVLARDPLVRTSLDTEFGPHFDHYKLRKAALRKMTIDLINHLRTKRHNPT